LTIYAYIISKQTIKQVNISDPLTLRKEMIENPEESLWIHADEPANIFHLQDIFGLHPLAVDAIVHRNQPSKVEEYGRYLFTIIDGVRFGQQKEEEEDARDNYLEEDDLYIFLEQRWIVTINFYNHELHNNIRKKVSKSLIMLPSQSPSVSMPTSPLPKQSTTRSSTDGICEMIYRFAIEEIISSYYPIIDKINSQLEQIEDYIILAKPTKSQLSDIILIRRKLGFMESTLAMISRAFEDVISGVVQTTRLGNDSTRQIRSLNDRVVYLQNSVENMHQRVINLREAYNSSLSADLNETIRTLTVIATIILPLTLIAGIYGMNFDVIPELHSPFGYYYALSLMAAVAGSMIIYFRKKKWI
jgi:magnesium transporter